MHIVIMGCGRVGSTLAHILEDRGNSVAVIDQDPEAFRKLRASFKGSRVTGMGFDRDVLIQAGIAEADAFAAVSSGDNSNIISARVVRESFGIERVAARIYDPRRAEVYQRLGITTVATVKWIADQVLLRAPAGVVDPGAVRRFESMTTFGKSAATPATTFAYPEARVIVESRIFTTASTYSTPRAVHSADGAAPRSRRMGDASHRRRLPALARSGASVLAPSRTAAARQLP